jgi:acyl-CoA synthetase (AMP-forming)/AMP-acid ligase II
VERLVVVGGADDGYESWLDVEPLAEAHRPAPDDCFLQLGVVTMLGPDEHRDPAQEHRLISAGTPISGVEIEIRDPATGDRLPTEESGEVWVRTDQLMSGY